MDPDTAKIWTRPAVRASVEKLIVESLGVDEAKVTGDAALIRDLGAESIDFLDLSFKCQQTFAVDLPMRSIQQRRAEWRDLTVLAGVLEARYRLAVPADELMRVKPATVGAILEHLAATRGVARAEGDAQEVLGALVARMLADLAHTPLDLADLTVDRFAGYLEKNLHSPEAADVIMDRLTVRAVAEYVAAQLAATGRLAPGA